MRRWLRAIVALTTLAGCQAGPPAIKAILAHLGEPIAPPIVAPARGPPRWNLAIEPVPDWVDTPPTRAGLRLRPAAIRVTARASSRPWPSLVPKARRPCLAPQPPTAGVAYLVFTSSTLAGPRPTHRMRRGGPTGASGTPFCHATRPRGTVKIPIRPSVDACIQDRQYFLKYAGRGFPNSLRLARPEVDRLDLLHHDEPGHAFAGWNGHMERVVAEGIGNRTCDAQPGVPIEQIVADDQSRTTPPLLVT
jgi:hypothetical protein